MIDTRHNGYERYDAIIEGLSLRKQIDMYEFGRMNNSRFSINEWILIRDFSSSVKTVDEPLSRAVIEQGIIWNSIYLYASHELKAFGWASNYLKGTDMVSSVFILQH